METEIQYEPWEQVQQLVQAGDVDGLYVYLATLSPSESARTVARLSAEEAAQLLIILGPEEAARLLEELPEAQAGPLLEELSAEEAAAILDEMPSDEQADLLAGLDEEDAAAIVRELPPDSAAEQRQLSQYGPDTAGGLMITEYLSYPEHVKVTDVVEDLRTHAEEYSTYDVQYAYVVSRDAVLVGVLRLRDLLLATATTSVSALMIRNPVRVVADASLDELQQFFDRHRFFGAPVVDTRGSLVGVVRRVDVEEAVGDRADQTLLKVSGIVGGEELRSMPLAQRASRRLAWLSINVVLNLIAASVIAVYQDTLAVAVTLAIFLPIVSDMSGSAGNQAVAVSLRELALGLVQPADLFRILLKEAGVGIANGVMLGVLLGVVAWVWQGNAYLGAVVGAALALNTLVAVLLGGTIPLVLRKFNADPALASGLLLTTVTDMCGFFFTLSFATVALKHLAT
ncbi:MAG: magnesium transporter [Candidatus Binatia bacterium]